MNLLTLRQSIDQIGTGHDSKDVKVWLPGSRIRLEASLMLRGDDILIEGNLEPGSALEGEDDHLKRIVAEIDTRIARESATAVSALKSLRAWILR